MLADRMRMSVDGAKTFNIQDAIVVDSAYDTSGNGGRKLVRLSNGWLVTVLKDSSALRLYKSTDNGRTWSQLTYNSGTRNWSAMANKETMIYLLWHDSDNGNIGFSYFDATTVGHTFSMNGLFMGAGFFKGVSIAISKDGTQLHATWSCKGGAHPNSFNIYYIRGTINVDGSVTWWSSAEQVTTVNTTGSDYTFPSIVVDDNNIPLIIVSYSYNNNIVILKGDTSLYDSANVIDSWSHNIIHSGGADYPQSNPSVAIDKDGVIHTTWHGVDSANPSSNYLRYAKSAQGGFNWIFRKLGEGQNPSLTVDKNNKLYIEFERNGNTYYIMSYDGLSWSPEFLKGGGTNPNTLFDRNFGLDFSVPLSIRKTASSVLFSGTWRLE